MGPTIVALLTLTLIGTGAIRPQPRGPQDREDFAVEITGGPQVADEVALKYGLLNRGKVNI